MKQTGVATFLALLMVLVLCFPSAAPAEDGSLNIISCEQQEKNIVMEFVCLDETNTPVSLPLNAESWTVRGEKSLTDLKVDSIRRYSGGIHYVFVFESSAAVQLSRVTTAMKSCFSHLSPLDCITIIQLDSKAEVKLSRSVDEAAATEALKKTIQPAAGSTPRLYDGISQAISLIDGRANERTVMIILSTGTDANSTQSKFQTAQQLEEAKITAYAVLLPSSNNRQDLNGLAPLCVRGGFPVRADKVTKAQQMADVLAGLLPVAREVYTLTAHATDSSYNSLSQAPLRVFAYQGEKKISGGVALTTDSSLFTALSTPTPTRAAATATPLPTQVPAVVTEAPSPLPTQAATAQPATPSPQPMPTAAAQPEPPEKTPDLSKYLVPGAFALGGLLAISLLSVLAVKAIRKKKTKKQPDVRHSPELQKIPFAPIMPGEKEEKAPSSMPQPGPQPPKPAPVKKEAAPPAPAPVPSKPVETPKMEVFVPDKNVPAAPEQTAQGLSPLDQTMDERRATPQKPELDQTMDERLLYSQTADMDKTIDEHRLYHPKKAEKEADALSAETLKSLMAPIPAADKTVVQVNRNPQLILNIVDAHGSRDVSTPIFSGSEITIGREKTDILLDANDHSISRNHLSIRLTASQLEVQDHSGNGTTVNGHLLRRGSARLTIGSVMELGGLDDAMEHKVKTVIVVKGFHCPDVNG